MLIERPYRLPFLVHDGHEMPLGDVCSPVKELIRCCTDVYDWLALTWDEAIAEAFEFPQQLLYSEPVMMADVAMRALERQNVLGLPPTLEDSIAMQGLLGVEWEEATKAITVGSDTGVLDVYEFSRLFVALADRIRSEHEKA